MHDYTATLGRTRVTLRRTSQTVRLTDEHLRGSTSAAVQRLRNENANVGILIWTPTAWARGPQGGSSATASGNYCQLIR